MYLPSFFRFATLTIQTHQVVQDVSASQIALFDLFDRIENFFGRLKTYVDLPPTPEMTDTIVHVMVEVLRVLALVTKDIKRGKLSKLTQ